MVVHVGGSLPPPGMEWQVGKTAASIRWVAHLEEAKGDSGTAQKAVQDVIDALKSGTMMAREFPPEVK
jgi:hypothetical protein